MSVETELEQLINANGVTRVIDALANVCLEKVEHFTFVRKDPEGAKDWQDCADRLMAINVDPAPRPV